MSEYIFLFDLDSTITKVEILPEIAREIGMAERMQKLTEMTMSGEIPFERSFLERVELLKSIPVSQVSEMIKNIPLNEELVDFIRNNRERCYVVTGNLDVWIEPLMNKMGLSGHYFCSNATVKNDSIETVTRIINKVDAAKSLNRPFVAIGDGNNDADMISAAEIGIGFGGVRDIAPAVLESATHATYSEDKLCQFLKQLL